MDTILPSLALWVEEKAWVFVGKRMKRIDRQEYDDLMNYLWPIFRKIWEHENEERNKVGKTLDAFQFGFSIYDCIHYKTENCDEEFYIIYNTGFLRTISHQIILAQQQCPEKFGTGNADDVIDALYNVSGYNAFGDKNAYLDYLIDYNCCYVVYTNRGAFGDVLKIDLLRRILPNKKVPSKNDFVGGLLHVLKHFSVKGKNLVTGNDINNVFDIRHIIYLIAMAFRLKKQCDKDHSVYEAFQNLDKGMMHVSFYKEEVANVYYLKTYFKDRKKHDI